MKKFKTLEDYEEDTIYSRNCREDLIDNDEISPVEEGFMEGWEQAA